MTGLSKKSALLLPLVAVLLCAPAFAQGGGGKGQPAKGQPQGDEAPPGTIGEGVITGDQLAKDITTYKIDKYDIHVHFALPNSWKLEEQSVDPKTKKMKEGVKLYVVNAMAPHEKNEPTDFIFEVDIFEDGLTADMPKDTPDEKRKEERAKRFWSFLNAQLSLNIKMGNKPKTQRSDIQAKPYGMAGQDEKTHKLLQRPGRPVQFFVPIFYEVAVPATSSGSKGAMLYTFSTFTGDTPWMIKFLVSKDEVDTYGALIAFIMDNSFGLTDPDYKALLKAREAAAKEAEKKPKQQ